MNLTYEVTGNGYIILNNGSPWIVQTDFIPYPGDTMAESAQNHINNIIAENENAVSTPTIEEQLIEKGKQIQMLKEQQLRTDADLAAFMDFMLSGGM